MASGMSLIIIKNSSTTGYDITELVETVVWKGRKGSAARSLTVTLIDDDGYKHERSEIDVEEGHSCLFSYDGTELFRGLIMTQKQTHKKKLKFVAYDVGIYLSNNKDTFCYSNKTATDVFKDICSRYGLPTDEVAKCTYTIPELTKSKTTAFDAICDALSLDFENTGVRHYVSSDKGVLSLKTRKENIMQWVVEVGQNLISYTYTRSIEDIKTRIKLLSDEGTVLAEAADTTLEAKIGVFTNVDTPDETLTTAQLKELVQSMLEEESTPERSLEIEAVGIPDVISGIGVFIIIPALDLKKTFYVDQDVHTFTDRYHSMSLTLNYASDIGRSEGSSTGTAEKTYAVGDEVTFNGGYHYVSSNASSPTGGTRKAGKAKITLIASGAKHPYHLIGGAYNSLSGDCNVYGWVDSGTFS